jgi:arsenate reductase
MGATIRAGATEGKEEATSQPQQEPAAGRPRGESDMKAWMTHNPKCGTSRAVLAILRDRGIAPEIRAYLEAPLSRAELAALIKEMAVPAHSLVRWKEKDAVAAAGIDRACGDAAVVAAMAANPILLNRPIVRTDKGTRLCRPSETVNDLL